MANIFEDVQLLTLDILAKFKTKFQDWTDKTYTPLTRKINNHDLNRDITLTADDIGAVASTEKGVANGVATLDEHGLVPSNQLPSYVDDIIDVYFAFDGEGVPILTTAYSDAEKQNTITPESGKIYVDVEHDLTYRWSGSVYAIVSQSLAMGETATTAFRGDYGKIAYDYAIADNPSKVNSHTVESDVPADAIWEDMTGATESTNGTAGYVPAPSAGDQNKYLAGDGSYKGEASVDAAGLMSSADYVKLSDFETSDKYVKYSDITFVTESDIDDLFT